MITNERAIEILKEQHKSPAMFISLAECREYNEAIDKAIEAVKLQIPQKPEKLVVTENLSYLICPVCRKSEVSINRRCPYCGQAIDWGEYVLDG